MIARASNPHAPSGSPARGITEPAALELDEVRKGDRGRHDRHVDDLRRGAAAHGGGPVAGEAEGAARAPGVGRMPPVGVSLQISCFSQVEPCFCGQVEYLLVLGCETVSSKGASNHTCCT